MKKVIIIFLVFFYAIVSLHKVKVLNPPLE